MRSNIRLGRILGIPVGLSWTWFLVFGVMTVSLAMTYFRVDYLDSPLPVAWLLSGGTVLLFFASILLHEVGHAWLALRSGIQVDGITLHLFGGAAQLEREPATPAEEFAIAAAGPAVNLLLSISFLSLWYFIEPPFLSQVFVWLARINLGLALFNLIPGFPLDGGRMLRAAMWRFSDDYRRSTHIAGRGGQVVAFGFAGGAIFAAVNGNFASGIWLAMLGWFLFDAARTAFGSAQQQVRARPSSPCLEPCEQPV